MQGDEDDHDNENDHEAEYEDEDEALEELKAAKSKQTAEDLLYGGLLSIPSTVTDYPAWEARINELLRTRVDIDVLWAFVELVMNDTIKHKARLSALARHAGSRAAKAKVFTWCDQNMDRFKSMDDAALDIAESFIPAKFRTVREWMTEWKKLRLAGTP